MKILIDRNLITDRMNDLGLSERSIIQKTRLPQFQFRQARQTGQLDGHISLAEANRLATELGVSLPELLAPPAPDASEAEPTTSTPEEDLQLLIPLLVTAPHMVSIAHVARTLGWTRDHIEELLTAIPPRLTGTGLRLHTNNGRITITAVDSGSKTLRYAVGRLQTTTMGVTASSAATLRQIVNGDDVFHRNVGQTERLSLGALKNMGCIELDDKALYRPTSDMRLVLPDIP